MYVQRETDLGPGTYYRSGRISTVNGQHFFSTREGTLEGPYFTRLDAEREIQRYILRQRQAQGLLESRNF
ncbi:DUF6316 family protein [Zestomonas thermotolerans]|uniref:DUF6316 family protein n=1 Tax=Zestomonas thermotolerans TaxID=157784 RepID=UPI0003821189|nr:DUF6316 family protein [Pseudomonas thermotolerans]